MEINCFINCTSSIKSRKRRKMDILVYETIAARYN